MRLLFIFNIVNIVAYTNQTSQILAFAHQLGSVSCGESPTLNPQYIHSMHTYGLHTQIVTYILISFVCNICVADFCPGEDSIPCPGTGGGCLHKVFMCDGVKTCQDGSDESTEFCSKWPCQQGTKHVFPVKYMPIYFAGFSKCPNGVKCIPSSDLCFKAGHNPYRVVVGRKFRCGRGEENLTSVETCKR